MIKEIAEKIIGRSLKVIDGINAATIAEAEGKLGVRIPEVLKEFYLLVGNMEIFMSSFDRFFQPNDMYFEHDALVFVEENQAVCCWGIKKNELSQENPIIYQFNDPDNPEWYSEEIGLVDFLQLLMYYQCAQGGYEYSAALCKNEANEDEFVTLLKHVETEWEKVVDHNHLIIYWNNEKMIWFFTDEEEAIADDMIFISAREKAGLTEMEEAYGFEEL